MDERRRSRRMKTYLGGQAAFNNRTATMDCLVRNFSEHGARLVFSYPVVIPHKFDLTIHMKGDSRLAQIMWRTGHEAGIAFLDKEAENIVPIQAARRISALQSEREVLRKRVDQLTEPA